MGAGPAVVLLVRARGEPEAEGDPVARLRRGAQDEAREQARHAHGGLLPRGFTRRGRHPRAGALSLTDYAFLGPNVRLRSTLSARFGVNARYLYISPLRKLQMLTVSMSANHTTTQ